MTKILVIEDDAPTRASIVDLLEAEEFEVISAENGVVGLELARHQPPALIISDILMPGLDGYQLLAALREQADTAQIPVIFLSAKVEEDSLLRAKAAGAAYYLAKPFDHSTLLAAIQACLPHQDYSGMQNY
jgi:DNA-binding response OmpR family regulator